MKRRKFITRSTQAFAGVGLLGLAACGNSGKKNDAESGEKEMMTGDVKEAAFKISLAQWSLHKALFAKEMTTLDFARITREEFDIDAIEYVNVFFKDKAKDKTYLDQLNSLASDHGIYQNLIMVDGEGGMADLDAKKRMQAVENHKKWVEAAQYLGCKTIRVNAHGEGSMEDVQKAAIEGLAQLAEFAKPFDINVVVENHGSYSSNGAWLAEIMHQINMPNCGTLPDFGNFCISRKDGECTDEYDRYKGVTELMPYAHAVSAKSHDFDANGDESHTDYYKMMDIVLDAGYHDYVGIEYEGNTLGEYEGIKKTKALLEKIAMA
ncbi:sugar phosphate isomerase/epimerase family protein [Membranihabitans marinus]|uniref:sugar phosphate isomerase/epimerase family protein n=1 Tax=Membranihabitans marinus TaxID=1227546 RepID=UPI001F17F604|nr:sugar phosphate isomerase/epimerase family protein [Membranihabitans marinus]